MFVCAYMLMNREIYYKALAPGIMEVEKSRPRRSDSVNSDQSLSPINRRVDGGNQVLVQSEGRRPLSQFMDSQADYANFFLLYLL